MRIFLSSQRGFLIGILALASMAAKAQPAIEWQKCLGGSGYDFASSIAIAHDSGYIIAGSTYSNDGDVSGNHGTGDTWVARLNNNGGLMWQKCLGGTRREAGGSIKATSDGGYIIATTAASYNDGNVGPGHGQDDMWLIKLDGSGNIVWEKTYGGSENDAGLTIAEVPGGYVAGGYTISTDGDVTGTHVNSGPLGMQPDCWVIKVNDTGKLMWQRTFGGSNDDEVVSIKPTSDGGYIFTGLAMSNDGDVTNYHGGTSEGGDCWVVKLNDTGALVWQKTFGGSMEDQGFDVIQARNGNYIVGASSISNNGDFANCFGQVDAWLIAMNDTGGVVWMKNYGGTGSEYVTGLQQTDDEGYAFCGWNGDMWLVKTDASGNQLWQKSYGGSKSDDAWGMQLCSDGGAVAVGSTMSYDGDATGIHDTLYGDIWAVKFKPLVGVHDIHTSAADIKVYPTPTTGTVYITLPAGYEQAVLTVYNTAGQRIKGLENGHGLNRTIALNNVASGIYILEVVNGKEKSHYKISYQP